MARRPSRPKVEYSWGSGAAYAVPADVVGEALDRLEAELGHEPNAAEFVAAARDPKSVLHPLLPFQKTQRALAEMALERVAADVLRHLKVTFITPKDREVTLRARFSLPVGGRRGYVPIGKVLSNAELRQRLLADALRDAEVFCKRYADLLLATGAVTLADKLVATLEDFLTGKG